MPISHEIGLALPAYTLTEVGDCAFGGFEAGLIYMEDGRSVSGVIPTPPVEREVDVQAVVSGEASF